MHNRYDFLYKLDLSNEVVNRLSLLLDSVVSGSKEVFQTPLLNNRNPKTILSDWDRIFKSRSSLVDDDLLTLENLNRDKFGPRSLAADWETRRESVYDYFSGSDYSQLPNRIDALQMRLRPLSLDKAIRFLKNDTNSGLPYYQRKGLLKDVYLKDFNKLLSRRDDCVMFTRTQEAYKTRTVWGYPMADTLNEMRFYRPLLEHQKKLNWRSALLGPEAVDLSMTKLITSAVSSNSRLLSIDFSAYDSTINSKIQKLSFDYIRSLFQPIYSPEIDYIEDRFNKIGIITPDGILKGEHGVPSGSTFTNEVDSIAQFLCARSLNIQSSNFDIQGDDGVYMVDDPDYLKEGFRKFGFVVNDEKSYISNNSVVFLQNLHSTNYNRNGIFAGIYPTYRALNRILYQERFNDFSADDIIGADYYSIRTISILENCRNHPLFPEIVKFVYNLDKYNLRFSQDSLSKYIKRITSRSGIEGIFVYRPEDNIKGIRNFETVKLLSEL